MNEIFICRGCARRVQVRVSHGALVSKSHVNVSRNQICGFSGQTPRRYDKQSLAELLTIRSVHDADLKFESDTLRVWLSRMTIEDGAREDHAIEVDERINGEWTAVTILTPLP